MRWLLWREQLRNVFDRTKVLHVGQHPCLRWFFQCDLERRKLLLSEPRDLGADVQKMEKAMAKRKGVEVEELDKDLGEKKVVVKDDGW